MLFGTRKTLKIFIFTTTNAYLWNLSRLCTFIRYFIWLVTEAYEGVSEKNRKPVFWFNFYGFLGYIKNRSIYDALPCITSLMLPYIMSLYITLHYIINDGVKMRATIAVLVKLTWVMKLYEFFHLG